MPDDTKPEEIVDMDEVSKSTEVLDEAEVEEESDSEPTDVEEKK